MLELRWIVFYLIYASVFGQFNLDIIDYNGVKYLQFNHPCSPGDTYCPLTCSQKYHILDEASNKLCVSCVCKDGLSGITKPLVPTTTMSPSIASSTKGTTPTSTTTTPVDKEVVMINGIPNILVHIPCSTRDNVCPIHGCTVDGKLRNSELCFTCECGNQTVDETKVSTTASTVPSTTTSGVFQVTKDTLVVNGVVKFIVSNPCRVTDNLCPVEGCTVDLTTRGNDVCFTCNCTKATARRWITSPAKANTMTSQESAMKTKIIDGRKYAILKNPCTTKDELCPLKACTVTMNVVPNKPACMSCRCD